MECGLLGEKLGHSYSPAIHKFLGNYTYSLYEKKPEELEDFLKNGSFSGLNVTIPYKKAVIPYCAALTPVAQQLGAVNTIVRKQDGTLIGHNTDYFGFSAMVKRSGLCLFGKKALVLGSGGASNTAVAVLKQLGMTTIVISRSGENNYHNLHRHTDAALIVNATPVGMYPNCGSSPVSLDYFSNLEGVLDLIYNPARTQLLMEAEARGLAAENGLWMLVAQAKESAEWFTGRHIPNEIISVIYRQLRQTMENIVLIGMPGCGKTTIGKLLAEKTGRDFFDTDSVIEHSAGMSIPKIFATKGENVFRSLETNAISQLGKRSGVVIATGGGCVTREENYSLLHQNGILIWLEREIDSLPILGRPLSQPGKLAQMYASRKPLYEKFADYVLSNNGAPEKTAFRILEKLEVSI